MTTTVPTQRCRSCQQDLPVDAYSPSLQGKTTASCRQCRADTKRQRYQNDPEFRAAIRAGARNRGRPCGACGTMVAITEAARAGPPPICHPCRRAGRGPTRQITCYQCRQPAAVHGKARTCRPACQSPCDDCGQATTRHRTTEGRFCQACSKNRSRARTRKKEHLRRATAAPGLAVTPAYEQQLRRKTKRCPMPGCGAQLTDTPYQPNSRHLDHIVPLNIGGTHTIGNVRSRTMGVTAVTHWADVGNQHRDQLPADIRRGRGGRPYRRLQARVFAEETHCWQCLRWVDPDLPPNHDWARSLDHVIPLALGGDPLDRANARLAHRWCNTSKGSRLNPISVVSRRW